MILALSENVLSAASVIGMLIFLTVFLGAAFWAATRTRREVKCWSHLPLDESHKKPS